MVRVALTPAPRDDGAPLTVHHGAPQVIDSKPMPPPPVLEMTSDSVVTCGEAEVVLNDSGATCTLSIGGVLETVRETATDCVVPLQPPELHVITTLAV